MRIITIVWMILLSSAISLSAESTQENALVVGSESIPLVFENTSLTENERNTFTRELGHFFCYSTNFSTNFPEHWSRHGFRNYSGPLYISMEPDFCRGLGYTNAPTPRLHVFQRLTNRYRLDGVEFSTYTNLHRSAVQFITSLNNGSVTNLSTTEKRELFLILPQPPSSWNDAVICTNLVNLTTNETYFPPSFFDFKLEPPIPPFSAPIPSLMLKSRSTGGSEIFSMPIVYVDGGWKFLDIVE